MVPTLDDALGLMNPAERTPVKQPSKRKVAFLTPTVTEIFASLEALIEKHAETPVVADTEEGQEVLLGNLSWNFPSPRPNLSVEEDRKRLPLLEVWEKWYNERPKKLRDKDGMELVRAKLAQELDEWDLEQIHDLRKRSAGMKALVNEVIDNFQEIEGEHTPIIGHLLEWFLKLHPPGRSREPSGTEAIPEGNRPVPLGSGHLPDLTDFLLDAVETLFALIPESELKRELSPRKKNEVEDWRGERLFDLWWELLDDHKRECGERWTTEQKLRYWNLAHWRDQPVPGVSRSRPGFDTLLMAYEVGGASQADILDDLLGPRETGYYGGYFASLTRLTALEPPPVLERRPELKQLVERVRERILEVELDRGELPTAATGPARALGSLHGLDMLETLLLKLDGKPFARKFSYGESKTTVLTSLIHITYPAEADSPEVFAQRLGALIKQRKLPAERVLELAFLRRSGSSTSSTSWAGPV